MIIGKTFCRKSDMDIETMLYKLSLQSCYILIFSISASLTRFEDQTFEVNPKEKQGQLFFIISIFSSINFRIFIYILDDEWLDWLSQTLFHKYDTLIL
jgi:hypothetical protein